MNRVFIGWDARESEAADVLRYSINAHASKPVETTFIKLDDCIQRGYHPALIMENCVKHEERPGTTDFTYTRFLVPWLCGYEGLALFMDCDMLVVGDINEVFDLPMDGLALRCTQHDFTSQSAHKMWGETQVNYPRKLWSSFMLLDCAKLYCWALGNVACWGGQRLHRFEDIPDEQIGAIPLDWNEVEHWSPRTRCYHWTEGGPWLTQYANHQYADRWNEWRDRNREHVNRASRDPA